MYYTKDSTLYKWVGGQSPKQYGDQKFMCAMDAKHYSKYGKDDMGQFLAGRTLITLRGFFRE